MSKSNDAHPLLVDACLYGYFDIVTFLLKQGVNIKAKTIEALLHSMLQSLLTIIESVSCCYKTFPIQKLQNVHLVDAAL